MRASESGQILAVGVNCTAPRHISSLLKSAGSLEIPLAVYPNSGEEWSAEDQSWSGMVCDDMPVTEWYDLGARIVGGCCRTSAEHIGTMRDSLRQHTVSLREQR